MQTFLLDSLGVCAVGTVAPFAAELVETQAAWGAGDTARVVVYGGRVPAPTAALINSFQLHNSEYDCVHEGAVVHPMAVQLGPVLAEVERQGSVGGERLLLALALGIDVAAGLGVASRAPLRFFRPATAGAVGKLRGFDAGTLRDAMAIVYGQLCGNMQAHVEGSPLLAMQVGFNARNAVVACDLAAAGLSGPSAVMEGPYGYLNLIEGDYDFAPVARDLGKVWRVTEVAHKPFPSGRATHGIIEILLRLRRDHGLVVGDIAAVRAFVPPLVQRLIGRKPYPGMAVSYARLSAPYTAARALLTGGLDVPDYRPECLGDPATLALADRIEVLGDDNPDPNALVPIAVEVRRRDGSTLAETVDTVYGAPAKPMSRDDHLGKFRRNLANAARPIPPEQGERLVELVDKIDRLDDATALVDLLVASRALTR
jgi:2-methylcitrate dehydratase PrpD